MFYWMLVVIFFLTNSMMSNVRKRWMPVTFLARNGTYIDACMNTRKLEH